MREGEAGEPTPMVHRSPTHETGTGYYRSRRITLGALIAVLAAAGSLIAWRAWYEPPRNVSQFVENSVNSTVSQYERELPQITRALGLKPGPQSQTGSAKGATPAGPSHGLATSRGTIALVAVIAMVAAIALSTSTRRVRLLGAVGAVLAGAVLLVDGITALVATAHVLGKLSNYGQDTIFGQSVDNSSGYPALGASGAGALALVGAMFAMIGAIRSPRAAVPGQMGPIPVRHTEPGATVLVPTQSRSRAASQVAQTQCPSCGEPLPDDASFCGACGLAVDEGESQGSDVPVATGGGQVGGSRVSTSETGSPVPDKEQAPVTCAQCGQANRPSSRFCRDCGAKLAPDWSSGSTTSLQPPAGACPDCRHINPLDSEFCRRCGTSLGVASPQAPPPQYAGPVEPPARAMDVRPASATQGAPVTPAPGRPGRGGWLAALAVVAVLLAAGGAGVAVALLAGNGSHRVHTEPIPTTTESITTTTEPTNTTPTTTETEAEKTQKEDRAVEWSLQSHFEQIKNGDYGSAWTGLTGTAAGAAGNESVWVRGEREDRLESFSLSVSPRVASATTAQASIVTFQTQAARSGCKNWSGSWSLVKSGSRWLIAKANLQSTGCG